VWPDSIVEEGNLSQNVFLLRKALGESSKENRYILTIPGRGYQFAATLEAESPHFLVRAAHTQTTAIVEEEYFDAPPEKPPARLPAGKSRRWIWAGLAALAAMAGVGAILYRAARRPVTGGHIDIVVAEFVNQGKDPAFDLTLRRAVEIEMGQSPYLSVVAQAKVAETMRMMGKAADEKLSQPVALEVCQRNSGQAVIAGGIVSVGSHYLVTLDALDCATGSTLSQAKSEAASKEDVLKSLDRVTERVRRQLGESAGSIKQFDVPIRQATTTSFPALAAFSKATAMLTSANIADAIPLLDLAIDLDPRFALAYSLRGSIHYNLQEFKRSSDDHARAYALSGGLSEKEKLRVAAMYYWVVDEDLERAADASKVWGGLYPRDHVPWEMLANLYSLQGKYPGAVAAALEAVKLDPKSVSAYITLARSQKRANLFEDAKATCRKAFTRGVDNWALHSVLFQIAYFQKDTAGMARETAWGKGKAVENQTLDDDAWAAATGGRIAHARELFGAAIEASRRERSQDFPAEVLVQEAQVELFAGFLREARSKAERMPLDQDAFILTEAAIAAALSGGTPYAAALVARLKSDPRRSVLRDRVYIPLLEGAIAINRKKAGAAVKLLEPAQVYELRDYMIPFLRGRAFLEANLPEKAITEFRAIADNPGIDPISPMYPLAYLGMARAYRLQGNYAEGRAAYERFFDLWKSADADLPVLLEARREYSNLPSN
jgi:tetratricopeptide (TPR) repeat protein